MLLQFLMISFCLGMIKTNPATLAFLVEENEISISKSNLEIRISLKFTVPSTQTVVLTSLAQLSTLVTDWKALPCFAEESPLKSQLFNSLDTGFSQLKAIKEQYLRIYYFIGDTKVEPDSECILEFSLFNENLLEQSTKNLIFMRSGFSMTGTSAEIYAKKDVLRLATEFSISFTNLLSIIEDDISENLSNLNLIQSLTFPQSMRGILETAPCTISLILDFEKVNILRISKSTTYFLCEISVSEPINVKTYIRMKPISYNNVILQIPDDELIVTDILSKKMTKISCENSESSSLLVCRDSNTDMLCMTALEQGDIDEIIRRCTFIYTTLPNIAFRTINDGILVQGSQLSILEGGTLITLIPPLHIFSNQIVKISIPTNELSFSPVKQITDARIEVSRLTSIQIGTMVIHAYWNYFFKMLLADATLSYMAMALETLFGPLTILSVILSCRKRTQALSKKRKNKLKRRTNYDENVTMLTAPRRSQSLRR